jgi:hypothetical protein
MRHPIALLAAAGLALAAGCDDGATDPGRGVVVTTAVSPAEFGAGQPVTVTVTVENRGSAAVDLVGEPCQDPFTVTTGAGVRLPAPSRVCDLALRPAGPPSRRAGALSSPASGRATWGAGRPCSAPASRCHRGRTGVSGYVAAARGDAVYAGPAVSIRVLP